MRRLIVVFGAGGQLGESMVSQLSAQHEVVARDRRDVDITPADAVYNTLRPLSPDVVINCAAYTNVDGAENDPVSAFAVNAMAVRTLARAAGEVDATFVHFSTDFVFDGRATQPYTEADAPNPRGTYGVSKLTGEFFAVDCPRHYILQGREPLRRPPRPQQRGQDRRQHPVGRRGARVLRPYRLADVRRRRRHGDGRVARAIEPARRLPLRELRDGDVDGSRARSGAAPRPARREDYRHADGRGPAAARRARSSRRSRTPNSPLRASRCRHGRMRSARYLKSTV